MPAGVHRILVALFTYTCWPGGQKTSCWGEGSKTSSSLSFAEAAGLLKLCNLAMFSILKAKF
jgi:hypothetical protein